VNISGLTYSNSGVKNSASTNTINGFSGTQADVLNYAQVLRDQGGFTVVVSSLTYNPTTTDTGEIIPLYDYMLNIK
jgi:hypothetical protein